MKKLLATACVATALLVPAAPGHASDDAPIVRTEMCPEGYVGRIVYVGDRYGAWLCYRLP